MSDIEIRTSKSLPDMSEVVYAKFGISCLESEWAIKDLLNRVMNGIADRYVEEHFPEIAAKLDQNAIANLAIAEASKKIAEEIQRKPAIIERTKREVYQRGILGGLRRVL